MELGALIMGFILNLTEKFYEQLKLIKSSFDTNEIDEEIHKERFQTSTLVSEITTSLSTSTAPEYVATNLAQYNFYFYSKIKTPLAYQETVIIIT